MYAMGSVGPLDAELQLMDSQELEATGYSEEAIDLGENFSPAPKAPVGLVLNIEELDTGSGNETYQVELQQSYDGVRYAATGLVFTLAATGQVYHIIGINRRYLRLKWTLGGTTPLVIASAWLTK